MNFPIIDSHVHLWDKSNFHYAWLDQCPPLDQSFLLSELLDATKNLHIESFVFIQSGCDSAQALDEVHWAAKLAERDHRIRGIVAHAPLEEGDEVLPYLMALKEIPLVKGVRRVLHAETDDFCVQKNFITGVQLLSQFDFSFDISIYSRQLPAVIRLVEQSPQVNFILDHMGKPTISEGQLQEWQENLMRLATLPNVWCKISGLLSEANHQIWRSDELKPYIFHAIETFGIQRVMFGSDWPMVNLGGSYSHWVHTLNDLIHHAPEKDWQKLFYENARQCYRLSSTVIEV